MVTPTYHVFAMYAAHQGAQAVRTVITSPDVRWNTTQGEARSNRGMNGSASLAEGRLTLTVTNPDLSQPRETGIVVRGRTPRSIRATTLASRDVHDHNIFAAPRTVEPKQADVPVGSAPLVYRFPPASVTRLEIAL